MLEVGNGGLTHEEEKTHFALWAFAKAPLIMGCDLSVVSDESLAILMNANIIGVNQDPKSTQAICMLGCDYWSKLWRSPQAYVTTLTGGETVALIVNWYETIRPEFIFDMRDLGVIASSY